MIFLCVLGEVYTVRMVQFHPSISVRFTDGESESMASPSSGIPTQRNNKGGMVGFWRFFFGGEGGGLKKTVVSKHFQFTCCFVFLASSHVQLDLGSFFCYHGLKSFQVDFWNVLSKWRFFRFFLASPF